MGANTERDCLLEIHEELPFSCGAMIDYANLAQERLMGVVQDDRVLGSQLY